MIDYATDGLVRRDRPRSNTKLFLDELEHDAAGYLVTEPRSTETNVPGVFAVGDVQDYDVSPGGHGGRVRLHGCARRRALPRSRRGTPDDALAVPRVDEPQNGRMRGTISG